MFAQIRVLEQYGVFTVVKTQTEKNHEYPQIPQTSNKWYKYVRIFGIQQVSREVGSPQRPSLRIHADMRPRDVMAQKI